MAEQSINVPQVLVFVVLTFLAVRWYLSKPAARSNQPVAHRPATRSVNPAHIDQVAGMFPQLSRRDIAWDLQRNGGNTAATAERVLGGRGLDSAPPSFNIPEPRSTAAPARTAAAAAKPVHPDLITRYNLTEKLAQGGQAEEESAQGKKKVWSQDRNERQANLQKRREEMILQARRKMEEKARAEASGADV